MDAKCFIRECTSQDRVHIIEGVNQFNRSQVPTRAATWTPLEFVVKDSSNTPIGGILAGIGYWLGLEVRILWVEQEYRGKGIGSALLRRVEEEARRLGASHAMLDTFDFQAPAFYAKQGYQVIGELENFPPGHRRIYFSKTL